MLELLGLVAMGVAWLVPDHYLPWLSVYNDSFMAICLCFMVVASTKHRTLPLTVPATFWVIVLVSTIPWLQWAAGQLAFSGDALVGNLYVLGLAIAVLVGFSNSQRDCKGVAALLAGATVAGSAISALIALCQALRLGDLGLWAIGPCVGGRACANLAQPNNLATLLGLGVLSLLLLREQHRIGAVLGGILLAVLLVGASLTQSRTAMLFGPAVIAGLFLARRRGLNLQTRTTTIFGATLFYWLLTWGWPLLQRELLLDSMASVTSRRLDAGRVQAWVLFIDALSQTPWTGVGWLQTASAQLAVADRHPPLNLVWQHAHNLFLELILWCGYPIGLLLSGLIVYWYVDRVNRVRSIESIVGMLIVTIFGIHSMLELPYHYAYFLIPIGLWIGHVEHACGAGTQRFAKLHWIPLIVSFVMVLGIWRDYPKIEEDARRVRFENLRIGSSSPVGRAPNAPFLSSLTEFLKSARTNPMVGMNTDQLKLLEDVVKRYPYAGSMAKLSWALALNGRLPEAVHLFKKIRFIHGEALYRKIRKDMHDRVVAGLTGLSPLDQAVSD